MRYPDFVLENMDKLTVLRLERELTQLELSRETGISVSVLGGYERNGMIPMKRNYNRLAEYFGWEVWE